VMVQHAASVIRAGREGQLIWHETWDMNEVLSGARIISSSPRSATDFNLSDCLGGRRILTEQYPTLAEVNVPGLSARQEQTSLLLGQLRASPTRTRFRSDTAHP
jgi:hypothetical protein